MTDADLVAMATRTPAAGWDTVRCSSLETGKRADSWWQPPPVTPYTRLVDATGSRLYGW